MPELPEVEIVRRELHARLTGERITAIRCADRVIAKKPLDSLAGRTIGKIERRGKWLRFDLGDRGLLFAHLGMTGDWTIHEPGDPTLRFERARIETKTISARYTDTRRFGKLIAAEGDIRTWTKLGPDPLHDGIDLEALRAKVKRRGSIKVALMDQTVLAGVGNIMAIEALWMARIDPRAKARRLKIDRWKTLVRSLRTMIERMLAYDLGKRDEPFRIYGKEKCPRCKGKLKKLELGGRSSTFCPTCQRR